MKILVTGSKGYIGSNMVTYLRDYMKWDVVVSEEEGVDAVVHLAACSSSRVCFEKPERAMENIESAYKILEFCRRTGAKLVFFSSCEVYSPKNMYAASKLAGEHMCSAYFYSYGVRSVVLRLINTYGGTNCQPDRFPSIVKKRFEEETCPHFIVHTKQKKSWIHVDDVCKRVAQILQRKDLTFETLDLVGEEDLTIQEFISSKFGTNFTWEYVEPEEKPWYNHDVANGGRACPQ